MKILRYLLSVNIMFISTLNYGMGIKEKTQLTKTIDQNIAAMLGAGSFADVTRLYDQTMPSIDKLKPVYPAQSRKLKAQLDGARCKFLSRAYFGEDELNFVSRPQAMGIKEKGELIANIEKNIQRVKDATNIIAVQDLLNQTNPLILKLGASYEGIAKTLKGKLDAAKCDFIETYVFRVRPMPVARPAPVKKPESGERAIKVEPEEKVPAVLPIPRPPHIPISIKQREPSTPVKTESGKATVPVETEKRIFEKGEVKMEKTEPPTRKAEVGRVIDIKTRAHFQPVKRQPPVEAKVESKPPL